MEKKFGDLCSVNACRASFQQQDEGGIGTGGWWAGIGVCGDIEVVKVGSSNKEVNRSLTATNRIDPMADAKTGQFEDSVLY